MGEFRLCWWWRGGTKRTSDQAHLGDGQQQQHRHRERWRDRQAPQRHERPSHHLCVRAAGKHHQAPPPPPLEYHKQHRHHFRLPIPTDTDTACIFTDALPLLCVLPRRTLSIAIKCPFPTLPSSDPHSHPHYQPPNPLRRCLYTHGSFI